MVEELIEVGKVVGTQGNRGELRVLPSLEPMQEYVRLDEVVLVQEGKAESSYEVLRFRAKGRVLILQLAGCDSWDIARGWVGAAVKLPRRKLKELPPDHYYWFETEGLDVFGEDGTYWGEVVEAFSTGSNDVYVVRNGEKEVLLPAIREVVREVDLGRKQMIVRILEGLVEEGNGV